MTVKDAYEAFLLTCPLGYLVGFAALCANWEEGKDESYAEIVSRRKWVARAAFALPIWGFFSGVLVIIGVVLGLALGAVYHVALFFAGLWRAAFPGTPPTDHDGPSQGGGYR